jgi:hypothetical protein
MPPTGRRAPSLAHETSSAKKIDYPKGAPSIAAAKKKRLGVPIVPLAGSPFDGLSSNEQSVKRRRRF